MITRRWHDASSFERLAGRRVSQKHGSKAAGTRTAAAEAAGPAGGRRRGRRIKQKADEHGFSSGCTDVNCGTWIPGISVKTAILGGPGPKISFACGALIRKVRGARPAAPDPPSIEHPRHLPGGGRFPGLGSDLVEESTKS